MNESEKVAEAIRVIAGKMAAAYRSGHASQTVTLDDVIEMMLSVADQIDPVN